MRINELKLLKGDPIEVVKDLYVYPLKLKEIAEIGDDVYNRFLSSIMISNSILNQLRDKTIPKKEIVKMYEMNDLEFIAYISLHYFPYLFQNFLDGLSLFLRSNVEVVTDVGLVITNEKGKEFILDNDLFLLIKKVIAKQNFIKIQGDSGYKPANAKAQALLEKMNKIKENIKEKNKEEGLSLKTIISIVSNYSNNLNPISVWELTVYQLYESYSRLLVWDEFHNQYMHLPHMDENVAKNLKHWATDINKIM
jgi:hypothetical protein